jgi:transcriptional regulator with XRE-family HTH domain
MELDVKITYKNDRLQAVRQAAGLSQSQLANASGISVRVLQDYERGARNLNGAKLSTLLKLCLVLKCKLSEIITDSETSKLLEAYNG